MKNIDLSLLRRSDLFSGIEEKEISGILSCLSAQSKRYEKGSYVMRFGEKVDSVGIVLSGSVNIITEDYWGNRNIIADIEPGMLFAESYACVADMPLKVSIQAAKDCGILWMDVKRILTSCSSACEFHTRLIRNLVSALAAKNILMNEKLRFISQRTTRDKLLAYLSAESMRQRSSSFTIPFDRQQLADYLSVDRSAMSNELSKMRREGILQYNKNNFSLADKGLI